MMLGRPLARLLAGLPLIALTATAIAAATPREVISDTSGRALEVLKDQSLDPAARRRRIEALADESFDFDTMSRLVLARSWSRLSPEQQPQFVDEFRKHLSVTYGRNLDSYRNEAVAILGDREEARGDWTVKSKIVRGGTEDIAVDYRLRRNSEQWKIIDVTIEGVSLVANFRSQFQEIVSNGGVDRLLTLLRDKNAAGESLLPPEKAAPTKQ